MTSRFAALKKDTPKGAAAVSEPAPEKAPSSGAKAREGKALVGGWFSKEASKTIRALALEEDTTVQALVGEGLDMVLRNRGKHPFGER